MPDQTLGFRSMAKTRKIFGRVKEKTCLGASWVDIIY
jgi:hypothetical protein